MTISLIFCLCNLIVTDSNDVSIEWERREMIEKSIRSASNARRILRAYIDAKSTNSNFSILIKFRRRIKSINMMKRSIFSAKIILDQTSFLFLLISRSSWLIICSSFWSNVLSDSTFFLIWRSFWFDDLFDWSNMCFSSWSISTLLRSRTIVVKSL